MEPVKIMFISNGKGEDSIAYTIIKALQNVANEEKPTEVFIKALPLVGNGRAYERSGVNLVGNWKELPSRGFGGQRVSSLLKDISAGLMHITREQISVLNNEAATCDVLVCVGDMYPVLLAGLFTDKPIVHVATAISAYFHKYSLLERWLFKKFCKLVITRDLPTAQYLLQHKGRAAYFGNPMMDDEAIRSDGLKYSIGDRHIVTLVPSSRGDAYENTARMLKVIEEIGHKQSMAWILYLAPKNTKKKN